MQCVRERQIQKYTVNTSHGELCRIAFSRNVECPLPMSLFRRRISHSGHEARLRGKTGRRANGSTARPSSPTAESFPTRLKPSRTAGRSATHRRCCRRGRRLLAIDATDGIWTTVHDTVVVRVGCNCVPVFAAVNGGRGRGIFSSKCVIPTAPRPSTFWFFNASTSSRWSSLESHAKYFSAFPPRLPRNTFTDETMAAIRQWFCITTHAPKSA